MKSLHERLSDEHIRILEREVLKYPTTTEQIITALKENTHWTDLKYSAICSLVAMFRLNSFSPLDIDSLFVKSR